jgi:RHS repeat-associated protein
MGTASKIFERVSYSPYGVARHHWPGDVDGDGDQDNFDRLAINGGLGTSIDDAGYIANADLNRDGEIDNADKVLAGQGFPPVNKTALAAGELSDPNLGNQIGFDGYHFDAESQLYRVRHRSYDPALQQWLERDPLGMIEGPNLYAYVRENPIRYTDPTGLVTDEQLYYRQFLGRPDLLKQHMAELHKPRCCPSDDNPKPLSLRIIFGTDFATGVSGTLTGGDNVMDIESAAFVAENAVKTALAELDSDDACACISELTLVGHGFQGYMIVNEDQLLNNVDIDFFENLRPLLCEDAEIRLMACHVANDEDGYKFLKTIADVTGARVTGTAGYCFGGLLGFQGAHTVEPGANRELPSGWPTTRNMKFVDKYLEIPKKNLKKPAASKKGAGQTCCETQ